MTTIAQIYTALETELSLFFAIITPNYKKKEKTR